MAVTPPHRITIKYLITLFTTYGSIFEKTAAAPARENCVRAFYLHNSVAAGVQLPMPLPTI